MVYSFNPPFRCGCFSDNCFLAPFLFPPPTLTPHFTSLLSCPNSFQLLPYVSRGHFRVNVRLSLNGHCSCLFLISVTRFLTPGDSPFFPHLCSRRFLIFNTTPFLFFMPPIHIFFPPSTQLNLHPQQSLPHPFFFG